MNMKVSSNKACELIGSIFVLSAIVINDFTSHDDGKLHMLSV
jgi:hypothetical protein